jgi:hypothetical protein
MGENYDTSAFEEKQVGIGMLLSCSTRKKINMDTSHRHHIANTTMQTRGDHTLKLHIKWVVLETAHVSIMRREHSTHVQGGAGQTHILKVPSVLSAKE